MGMQSLGQAVGPHPHTSQTSAGFQARIGSCFQRIHRGFVTVDPLIPEQDSHWFCLHVNPHQG